MGRRGVARAVRRRRAGRGAAACAASAGFRDFGRQPASPAITSSGGVRTGRGRAAVGRRGVARTVGHRRLRPRRGADRPLPLLLLLLLLRGLRLRAQVAEEGWRWRRRAGRPRRQRRRRRRPACQSERRKTTQFVFRDALKRYWHTDLTRRGGQSHAIVTVLWRGRSRFSHQSPRILCLAAKRRSTANAVHRRRRPLAALLGKHRATPADGGRRGQRS